MNGTGTKLKVLLAKQTGLGWTFGRTLIFNSGFEFLASGLSVAGRAIGNLTVNE